MLEKIAALGGLVLLCGCSQTYKFGTLDSVYQAPEMPVAFAGDGKGLHATGFIVSNDQRAVKYEGDYTAETDDRGNIVERPSPLWSGDTTRQSYHETYRIKRDPVLLGGALILQSPTWFCGWTAGLALPDAERFNLGTYGGYSTAWGRFVPTVSVGAFLNIVSTRGTFWTDDGFGYSGVYYKDSSATEEQDLEIPVKAGLLYRLAPWAAPYATVGFNTLSFWPQDNPDDAEHEITQTDLALGVRYLGWRGVILSVEMALSDIEVTDRFQGRHIDSKLIVEKSL